MPSQLGEMTLEEAAREAAGNWQHFDCFAWHRSCDLRDADKWAIVYTNNRDAVPEHHHHWAVGHVDGFSIRVFRRHRITKAFRTCHELAQRLSERFDDTIRRGRGGKGHR